MFVSIQVEITVSKYGQKLHCGLSWSGSGCRKMSAGERFEARAESRALLFGHPGFVAQRHVTRLHRLLFDFRGVLFDFIHGVEHDAFRRGGNSRVQRSVAVASAAMRAHDAANFL